MPKIGAGLDGLNWDNILEILYTLFEDKKFDILVYYL